MNIGKSWDLHVELSFRGGTNSRLVCLPLKGCRQQVLAWHVDVRTRWQFVQHNICKRLYIPLPRSSRIISSIIKHHFLNLDDVWWEKRSWWAIAATSTLDALAPYLWPCSVSWCRAEGKGTDISAALWALRLEKDLCFTLCCVYMFCSQLKSPGLVTMVNGKNRTLYMSTVQSIEAATKPNLKKTLRGTDFLRYIL